MMDAAEFARELAQLTKESIKAATDKLRVEMHEGLDALRKDLRRDVDAAAAALDPRIEAKVAAWELEFERRAQAALERAVERMPKPKDGRDGLELEDFFAELGEDGRTVTMGLKRGDVVVSRSVRFPTVLYHGVFVEGKQYAAQDAVTFGGSVWIAKTDAPTGKPGTSLDWQLAVKAGRPGRDGRVTPAPGTPIKLRESA